jgi:hypothetical protein
VALNKQNIWDYYLPTMNMLARRLVNKWAKHYEIVVINDDLGKLMAGSIAKVGMGHDCNFLKNPYNQVLSDVNGIVKAGLLQGLLMTWYLHIPIIGQHLLDGMGIPIYCIRKLIDKIIERGEKNAATDQKNFLEKLFDVICQEKSKMEHSHLIGNVLPLFLVEMDTSSKALIILLFYLLAKICLFRENFERR